jgi:hypothetical protein
MSVYRMPRRAIHAGDPPEVFVFEQKLLAGYSVCIGRAADDIAANFPDPDLSAAAASSFVAVVGSDIPDETLRAAVKRLAAVKFRRRRAN